MRKRKNSSNNNSKERLKLEKKGKTASGFTSSNKSSL